MKKILIFLALYPIFLYAQNFEPIQRKFFMPITNDSVELSGDLPYFQQTKFVKGVHWDYSPRLGKVLGMTQQDIYEGQYSNSDTTTLLKQRDLNNGTLLHIKLSNYWTHCQGSSDINARGIQYSPVLQIDTTKTYTLQTRTGDSSNPIFGFAHIRGRITNNPTDSLYSKLIIDGDSLNGQVILEEPWTADQLHYTKSDTKSEKDYLCKGMYITINLRRNDNSSEMTSDSVLKIEIPHRYISQVLNYGETIYYADGGNLYIDSIPMTLNDNPIVLAYNRGRILKLDSVHRPDFFLIRKNMLPPGKEYITISAFLYLDKDVHYGLINKRNKYLNSLCDSGRISKLKLKVTYLGGTPLAINYVKFETPATKWLLAGFSDSLLCSNVQSVLNTYATTKLDSNGIKFFRFNTHIEGGVQQWIGERYLVKLLGDIITGERGPIYPHLYEHYVGAADCWYGMSGSPTTVSVPYFDFNTTLDDHQKWKSLWYYYGFRGDNDNHSFDNLFNSQYESELRDHSVSPIVSKTINMNKYLSDSCCVYSYGTFSPLAYMENHIYKYYVDSVKNSFLYSNKNWFNQSFIIYAWEKKEWKNPDSFDPYYSFSINGRGLTGEEFRLENFNPIIMGAKGLIYDGIEDMKDYQYTRLFFGLDSIKTLYGGQSQLDSTSDSVLLNDSNIGNDYLIENGEYMPFSNNGGINFDTASKYLGVPRNKIYMGRKSMRIEMKKLHNWIDANDSTLMKLKLQAWYGAGYKIWYNQHPKYGTNDSIIKKYIDYPNIRTRKLIGYNSSTHIINNTGWEENKDSSFYDLTLLATKDDSTMSKTIFVGIQNRRCDPLIYIDNNNITDFRRYYESTADTGFKFIPTAKFDELVTGWNNSEKTFFLSQWWKRLGCREITIPLKDPRGQFQLPNLPYKVIVTELKDNNWYSQAPYNDVVNDTINLAKSPRNLTFKLLPGSGKLLKLTYYYPEKLKHK